MYICIAKRNEQIKKNCINGQLLIVKRHSNLYRGRLKRTIRNVISNDSV